MKVALYGLILLMLTDGCTSESDIQPYLNQTPPGELPEVFAPGIVSTEKSELNSLFSPDGKEFYFSRSKKPGFSAIWMMRFEDGIWADPKPVSFATGETDVNPTMTTDGTTIYFGSLRDDTRGPKDIYKVERLESSEWGIPQNLGPAMNSDGNDNCPSVAADGTLYFHSDGLGGAGKQDIFKSEWVDGTYTPAENIGSPINTEAGEFDAYIARDESYLIFGSDRDEGGFGKTDLYISYRLTDGAWSEAVSLGEIINTPEYELCPYVTDDGKYFFFTSYRAGHGDVYWVDTRIIEERKPRERD
jgi:Tol biopolymer transport system component